MLKEKGATIVEYVLALAMIAIVAFIARDLWLYTAQNRYEDQKTTLNFENYQPLFPPGTPIP